MIRRLLSAVALVGALGMPARAAAKPPDLPMNETNTVTPQVTPEACAGPSDAWSVIPIAPASGEQPRAHPLLNMPRQVIAIWSSAGNTELVVGPDQQSSIVKGVAEEKLPPATSLYDALPAALPTPTLYQLRPTARHTLAGSLLFGVNPLLALVPTDKALDAPGDHPQQVAGDDVLGDMEKYKVKVHKVRVDQRFIDWSLFLPCDTDEETVEEIDWFQWLVSHWVQRHATPAPEQNEGYIHAIDPNSYIAGLTPVDAPEEIDAPLVPAVEALLMPQEDTPHKKKHKKHVRKAERLPMPPEDAGVICPWLRQQAADRHACQFADPEIGRDVLDNLERLKKADDLLELAKELASAGCIDEAMECCALAHDLCPGSPCADRAVDVMFELYLRLSEPATSTDEAAEGSHGDATAREHKCESFWAWLRQLLSWTSNEDSEDPTNKRIRELLSQPEELRQLEKEWERIWFTDHPSHVTPEMINGERVLVYSNIQDDKPKGVAQQVRGLMKACRLLMNEGLHAQAAELARQAYALDPERVMADPLIYKMHLLAATLAKQLSGPSHPAAASEDSEPSSCPYCPKVGKPIPGIVPDKTKKESSPATLLVPPMPPVDYEVVPALDRVLTETAEQAKRAGGEKASEEDAPSSLEELIETIMGGPGHALFGFGFNADGGLRLCGEYSCGGSVYHVLYSRGCLAIWKTPDGTKPQP